MKRPLCTGTLLAWTAVLVFSSYSRVGAAFAPRGSTAVPSSDSLNHNHRATISSTSKTTVTRLFVSSSRVARNPNFAKLAGGYLFPEISRRRAAYVAANPDLKDRIISLGIGDTTQPIPQHIVTGLITGATKLGSNAGYSGYGAEQGLPALRQKIAETLYHNMISADEVFVSDGAKCDISRLQQMFGANVITAVQDPSYPVYVDTSVMMGQTGAQNGLTQQYDKIVYMPCTPQNGFFPDYASLPRADVVYLCSPNNPTGAAATKEQLEEIVKLCKDRGSILVFDAAYAPFIRTPGVPKSIFEIDGARDVAIEVNSFSKYAGFTGVRLGWTVIPSSLTYADGTPVRNDFNRVMTTAFNGASNIVQNGGLACLDPEGLQEIDTLIDYYLENARILRQAMESIGWTVHGGVDAPYVFVELPESMDWGGSGSGSSSSSSSSTSSSSRSKSWEAFQMILEKTQVVTIPGAGFGPGGEGFLRLSAFAPRDAVIEACARLVLTLAPVKV